MHARFDGNKKANLAYIMANSLYFAVYGFIFLFLSIYLLANGFNNSEIGILMAVSYIVSVLLQQAVGVFADLTDKLDLCQIMAVGYGLIALFNLALLFQSGRSIAICLLYFAQIITIMAVQPCLNALNFQLQAYHYRMNFGLARSMGSVSYAIVSAVVGSLLGITGNSILHYGIIGFSVLAVLLLLLMHRRLRRKEWQIHHPQGTEVPAEAEAADAPDTSVKAPQTVSYLQFIRTYSAFLVFIAGAILLYYSCSTSNNFMYQIILPLGGTSADYGSIQGFRSALEIFPMVLALPLIKRFGMHRLIRFASVAFVVKAAVTLLANSVGGMYIAALIQIPSYGLYVPVCVYYVATLFDRRNSVKGMALFTMTYALASMLSSAIGGPVLNHAGPHLLLVIALIAGVAGAVVTFISLPIIDRKIGKRDQIF